ncbi:hypothetical protein JKP75_05115 [Blastococcus sp. TML/M2B]|uniref:hypothetical protein n=1 Tax=unclassified Blastococcus TaxID=2619396 RepID=UPI00190E2395|nr:MULTISPECIES: hypothetical protein [unclassified Blastococcus]MBN1092007.1 hypothetical protein [Blastococcus sp. TML/M2B]MBN1097890.1 hypothetical protein [Blastococcus sp. TML/C7B]
MRHPTDGALRRLVDEPAGVAETDRRHVAGCTRCLTELAAVREDAALVGTALTAPAGVDVPAAWARLSSAAAAPARVPAPASGSAPARRGRFGELVRRPAVAALAVGVVLAGAGTAAANDWLPIFRTQEVAAVGLTGADLVALPDLEAYGTVELTGEDDLHPVADAAAAAAESGLDVPEVDALPAGVTGEPVHQVGGQVTATFTFSAQRAAQAAAAAGEPLPTPPPGLDGSSVRLVAGPGVAQVWSTSTGAPGLVVGRAVAPTALSSGIPFETVRDYLLELPGLPDDVAAQLEAFTADGSTLPLPVPSDYVTTATEDVAGERATVLTTRDRTLAAVVWVADGELTVVAGPLDADEVLAVARGLR